MPGLEEEAISRGRATAGLDISYPLFRSVGPGADLILEPMAQLSASTASDLDPRIPIEDSQTLELDESSLFRTDRFPGYDLYEGGLRLTLGTRATLRWNEGRQASLFIGRSYRVEEEPAFLTPVPDLPTQFYDPTGLASQTSDWVVQGSFSPSDRIRGWGHATPCCGARSSSTPTSRTASAPTSGAIASAATPGWNGCRSTHLRRVPYCAGKTTPLMATS
jgi:LPS-assembly protein